MMPYSQAMPPRTHVGVSSIKHHKSKMCRFYAMGSCCKGNSCNFAHGREELCEARALLADGRNGASESYDVVHDVARVTLELDKSMGMMQMPLTLLENADSVDSCKVVSNVTTSAPIERPVLLQNTQIPYLTLKALAEHKDATTTQSDASQDSTRFDSISQASTSEGSSPWTWASSRQTTADTDDSHSSSVVAPQVVVETQRGLARAMRNKFHKTRMCEFFKVGKCRKRGTCNFAHAVDELSVQPDLSRTKLCPSVLGIGKCKGVDCTFAHDESELRMGKAEQQLRAETSGPAADLARQSLAGGSSYQLCVKNTFLTVEDAPETEVLKRASSAPGCLVPLERISEEKDKVVLRRSKCRSKYLSNVSEQEPQQVLAKVETQKTNRVRNSVAVVRLTEDPRQSSPPPKAHIARSVVLVTTPLLA